MRSLFPIAVLLAAQAGAAWAIGEANMARPGGTYSSIEADDPAACAQICVDDTICMAWSFRENTCELKATVPAQVAQSGATSGVSTRAPGYLRIRYEAPVAADPAASAEVRVEADPPSPVASLEEDDVSLALLGGPEPEESLRTRLGN
jgi:PAN domain